MICKNCKTAVDDNAKECNNCGAPINNNNNRIKWAIVILIALAVFLIYFLKKYNGNFTGLNNLDNTDAPPADSVSAEKIDSTIQAKPIIAPAPVIEEAHIPKSDADLEKSIDEVWEIVDIAVKSVNDYYDSYSQSVVFLSKNGYLFDNPAKAYVLAGDMEGLTDIEEKYVDESLMFFCFKPADLFKYSYLRVSESKELKIFAGLETKDGFAIAAANEQGGIINREDLKAVLDKYSWDHGEIRKVEFQSDEFEQIINLLSSYTGNRSGFDVRHLYRDNKYLSLVASPKDRPLEISQYIIFDTGDILNMEIGNIEAFNNYKRVINEQLPDFNQALLPAYDLGNSLKHLKTDFTDIVDAMLEAEFINNDDLPLNFSNGTSDFVYFEFESGKRFVGSLEIGTWKMYPIEDDETGRELMWNINKKAPAFIIKQY